ncbi:hypothetical protein L4174_023915 (plasmid) [Photobacterium sp. CCB-ST2H9]|uniref:hypothetical protein n=1 Tax=Photobacterium sp. CCB-ST2H9 TaxID=2912855 RepID=UPI00200492DF|nr:hypothetical protein [Photobacterium sp. CCB-ST2H9]UTM60434.1 hypothetical protein L4174_023915 [Photobacterium sp. CCB-ST2H9]
MTSDKNPETIGYITFVFIEPGTLELISLATAAFYDESKMDDVWRDLPASEDETGYVADMSDGGGNLVRFKHVSEETITSRLSISIDELLSAGREARKGFNLESMDAHSHHSSKPAGIFKRLIGFFSR